MEYVINSISQKNDVYFSVYELEDQTRQKMCQNNQWELVLEYWHKGQLHLAIFVAYHEILSRINIIVRLMNMIKNNIRQEGDIVFMKCKSMGFTTSLEHIAE